MPYVTDKMPLNFGNAGLLHRAFPNSKILHIRRNPIDTCLSIYMTYFGPRPEFAYKRENIVSFYQEYLRIMSVWRSLLPASQFLEIDYEDLVANPSQAVRKVVEFCGLPWEDAPVFTTIRTATQ